MRQIIMQIAAGDIYALLFWRIKDDKGNMRGIFSPIMPISRGTTGKYLTLRFRPWGLLKEKPPAYKALCC
jgi:hypothetical protein